MDLTNNQIQVSIVVPCRNEERFIGDCLQSIIEQDYPKDMMEILVVDGMSEDGTRKIIKSYQKKYNFIKLLDNEKKVTPCAFNIGIKQSRGNYLMIMGAHSEYQNDYISKCAKYLKEYNVDNVGGLIMTKARDDSLKGRAIAVALSHPFGVGNAVFRTGVKEPRYVDTVFGGCYKKEVFTKIGLFDENLIKGQDREFNMRLTRAGGKILLFPDIISFYYARSNIRDFCKWLFTCGMAPFVMSRLLKKIVFSWRNLVPPVFVIVLISFFLVSLIYGNYIFFLGIVGIYLFLSLYLSLVISRRESDIRYLIILPMIFFIIHFFYGVGCIKGMIKKNNTNN